MSDDVPSAWTVYPELLRDLIDAWATWRKRNDDYFKARKLAKKERRKQEKLEQEVEDHMNDENEKE